MNLPGIANQESFRILSYATCGTLSSPSVMKFRVPFCPHLTKGSGRVAPKRKGCSSSPYDSLRCWVKLKRGEAVIRKGFVF
jgi:hypothetical protein